MFNLEKITAIPDDVELVDRIIKGHQEEIDELLNDTEKGLGEGRTARVCFLNNEEVCIKIYKKPIEIKDVDFYLPPRKEKDFQDNLRFINTKTRVPKVYACYENNEDGHSFLMMETLKAVSIDDILEGRAKLPENFDLDLFEKELEYFIEMMHKNNIYHRDLHEGNIMIDNETGLPYVIDFGAASKFVGHIERGERGPYHQRSNGRDIILTSDESMIKNTMRKFRNYLTNIK